MTTLLVVLIPIAMILLGIILWGLGIKIKSLFVGLVVIGLLVWGGIVGWGWWQDREDRKVAERAANATQAEAPAPAYQPPPRPLLEKMVDAMTPLCDSINHPFELDTQGGSISLNIPTVRGDTVVKYSGKGTLPFPHKTRVPGLVCINTLTPDQEARVRIWRVIHLRQ
ncbi:MAG: hypothetical protein Q8O46_02630 [bacterium]|nr:hypothetical protein [bacterium]